MAEIGGGVCGCAECHMIVEGRPFTVGGEQRVAIAAVTTDANTDPDAEDVSAYGVDFNERSSSVPLVSLHR